MLPKERVIAALEFRRPDRIPTGETGVDYAITEQALGRPTLYRAKWKEFTALWEGRRDEYVESCKRDIVDLARCFEHDVVPAFLVPSRHKPAGPPEFLGPYKWRNADGRVFAFSPESEGHPFLLENPHVTVDDIQDIPVDFDESQLELVRHVVKEMGGTHFILGRPGDGIFPLMRYTVEYLLTGMIDKPEVIERIIEVETRYCMAISDILLDAGCDAVLPTSDIAGNNGPFMSPKMFRRFLFPWLKAECDAAHAKGKYFIKHTDGNIWSILDQMIEAGMDGWQGIQPRIGMTLPALQERYGGRLCFWGGVDVDTLTDGTAAQVAEEVRVACQSAPRAGGLVVTCGNSVMVGVKYQNYLAQLAAAKLYGHYDD
jgi:uroporphyrinogen-III decarboxylase